MASNISEINKENVIEGLYKNDFWNPFDCRLISYIRSPIELSLISSKNCFLLVVHYVMVFLIYLII